jgi:hypothetical protein
VIAVFSKYDMFRHFVKDKLEHQRRDLALLDIESERLFNQYYLANLKGSAPFARLESENLLSTITDYADLCSVGMHKPGQRCTDLIETTANALPDNAVAIMLLAIQRDNLEESIRQAVRR